MRIDAAAAGKEEYAATNECSVIDRVCAEYREID